MTTVVILMMGFGVILIVSAFEGTSVLQTFSDVWNNNITFPSNTGDKGNSGGQGQANTGNSGKTANITQPGIAPGTGAPSLGFRGDMVRHDVRYRYGNGR